MIDHDQSMIINPFMINHHVPPWSHHQIDSVIFQWRTRPTTNLPRAKRSRIRQKSMAVTRQVQQSVSRRSCRWLCGWLWISHHSFTMGISQLCWFRTVADSLLLVMVIDYPVWCQWQLGLWILSRWIGCTPQKYRYSMMEMATMVPLMDKNEIWKTLSTLKRITHSVWFKNCCNPPAGCHARHRLTMHTSFSSHKLEASAARVRVGLQELVTVTPAGWRGPSKQANHETSPCLVQNAWWGPHMFGFIQLWNGRTWT